MENKETYTIEDPGVSQSFSNSSLDSSQEETVEEVSSETEVSELHVDENEVISESIDADTATQQEEVATDAEVSEKASDEVPEESPVDEEEEIEAVGDPEFESHEEMPQGVAAEVVENNLSDAETHSETAEEAAAEDSTDTAEEVVEAEKAGSIETEVIASVQPDIAPGPGSNEATIDKTSFVQVSSEIQPGEKPENITPQLRADMYHNRFFAALSYIPLGFLVVFALKNESRFCIYHARQGLALFFAQFVGSLLTVIPYFGLVAFGFTLFLSIIGIVSAVRANDYFQFPVLGPISEKMTFI